MLPLSITVIILIIVLIVVLTDRKKEPVATVAPTPTPTATVQPSPTVRATATPTIERLESGWVEAEVVLSPTPALVLPTSGPQPTRGPRPTPAISQCAEFDWSSSQTFVPSAQVKVDIRVRNRCPYDLGPNNLVFEISGWRDGGRVQSVRGAPFETIRRGRSGDVSIGLPGSETWYDEIVVQVLD